MVTVLAIIETHGYTAKLRRIVRDAVETGHSVLYVSLNKTYDSLVGQFTADKLALGRFTFIDAITPEVLKPKPQPNCLYVPLTSGIKRLEDAIGETVRKRKISLVVFDSLSSLIIYQDMRAIVQFVSRIIATLSALNCSAVLTCLDSDEDSFLVQHVRMMVDTVTQLRQPEVGLK